MNDIIDLTLNRVEFKCNGLLMRFWHFNNRKLEEFALVGPSYQYLIQETVQPLVADIALWETEILFEDGIRAGVWHSQELEVRVQFRYVVKDRGC